MTWVYKPLPGAKSPSWQNDDPLDQWWICSEPGCGAERVNLPSKDGCCCPHGHGKIIPGLVSERNKKPKPRVKKGKDDVSMIIRGIVECQCSRGCEEDVVISVGGKALCWDGALKVGVNPKDVLGQDWRSK